MGHLWRSSFSSPPQGCGTQPLRAGKGGKKMKGIGGPGRGVRGGGGMKGRQTRGGAAKQEEEMGRGEGGRGGGKRGADCAMKQSRVTRRSICKCFKIRCRSRLQRR